MASHEHAQRIQSSHFVLGRRGLDRTGLYICRIYVWQTSDWCQLVWQTGVQFTHLHVNLNYNKQRPCSPSKHRIYNHTPFTLLILSWSSGFVCKCWVKWLKWGSGASWKSRCFALIISWRCFQLVRQSCWCHHQLPANQGTNTHREADREKRHRMGNEWARTARLKRVMKENHRACTVWCQDFTQMHKWRTDIRCEWVHRL